MKSKLRTKRSGIRFIVQKVRILIAALAALMLVMSGTLVGSERIESWELTDAAFNKQRIARLTRLLNHAEPAERVNAIRRLKQLGPEARVAGGNLVDLLLDDSSFEEWRRIDVYDEASRALVAMGAEIVVDLKAEFRKGKHRRLIAFTARQIGPDARGLLSELQREYDSLDEDEYARLNCLPAIAAIDPTGEQAVPLLLQALAADKSDKVRQSAARWLNRSVLRAPKYWTEPAPAANWVGQPSFDPNEVAGELCAALSDLSPEVRAIAAISLATYPEAAAISVPALLKLLEDDESYWQASSNHTQGQVGIASVAARALAMFSEQADEIAPEMTRWVDDGERCGFDIRAFADLVVHTEDPIAHLDQVLASNCPDAALLAAARLGELSRPLIPRIEMLLASEDEFLVFHAAVVLACLDADGHEEAVASAAEALSDRDGSDSIGRRNACYTIGRIGPPAQIAVPMLIEHLVDDEYGWLDIGVLGALREIGPKAGLAASAVIEHLGRFSYMSSLEERALVAFGPAIVPKLAEVLESSDHSTEKWIACLHVLGRFGAAASEATPAIIPLLRSDAPLVREAAVESLGAIASHPAESVPALERATADPRVSVRAAAARSLGEFGVDAAGAADELTGCLTDDYVDVRVAAVEALGRIGGRSELPVLERLAMDENVLVREAAREAVAALQENSADSH